MGSPGHRRLRHHFGPRLLLTVLRGYLHRRFYLAVNLHGNLNLILHRFCLVVLRPALLVNSSCTSGQMAEPAVAGLLSGRSIVKEIFVKGRIYNIVVK